MIYYNQLQEPWASVPYETRIDTGGVPADRRFVRFSGCGICSACMMVENLTDRRFSIEECVQLSYAVGANRSSGTSMRILAPAVAEKFDLDLVGTDEIEEVLAHLQKGGMAVAHVHAQPGDPIGLFTVGGHYMALAAYDGEDVCILDPSLSDEKFRAEGRRGKVKVQAPFVYASPEVLHRETLPRKEQLGNRYYLFSRKKPKEKVN